MAKVKVLFNGATRAVVLDEAEAMQFVKTGEARILGKYYRVMTVSPYATATAARPEKRGRI